ncbi:hypothetical protein Dsin_005213 [Dipteronia sinensis]|uniref:Uncharacterized protein n=1 Tax=Dipteronia sinensis TaxID=43782 RepID=A0AAE0EEH2_9ROSI|nr:hypothetical protein Dsin_005213 [Dipteronia sinensis]
MEAEKRKRSERNSEDRLTRKKKKEEKEKEKEEIATDAEVEEFFAILRRMQVAVKYFGEGWRSAVETEAAAAVAATATAAVDEDDKDQEVKIGEMAVEVVEEEEKNCRVLDLNATPEGESHVASA